jgi:hypothetical protein
LTNKLTEIKLGRTITTHLVEGSPKGIQTIEISNRTILAYVIPRAELSKSKEFDELFTPCLYFLFGESKASIDSAYIGETDNFISRVYDHNKSKDFWTHALVFTSSSATLNKAHILYLEYLAIKTATAVGNYDLSENKQTPKMPSLQRHSKDTIDEFFQDVVFITEFLNYPIFRVIETLDHLLFFMKTQKSKAQGVYDENGFTVLKGSTISKEVVPSWGGNIDKRNALIIKNTETIDNQLSLKRDVTFSSPSAAADFCSGSSKNGWVIWKTNEGKTLDSIHRNRLDE